MEFLLIGATALIASLLTFFSGFGLGTLLMPVFALFFDVEIAIALTGIVHLLNNIFKIALIGKKTNWRIVLKFGIPGFFGALAGAAILLNFSETEPILSYTLFDKKFFIEPLKLCISFLIFLFAVLELFPFYKRLSFDRNKIIVGGALSGFFGGLSGHQGALRSAFLIKLNLSKETFIATGVTIACIIDLSRLSLYFSELNYETINQSSSTLLVAIICAFSGAYFGKKMLRKITIQIVNYCVIVMLIFLSIAMALGII